MFPKRQGSPRERITELDNNVSYINDDKPFIRYFPNENAFYVYGTPWKGKHNLGSNVKVPLKAICFLNRGEENSIIKTNPLENLKEISGKIIYIQNKQLKDTQKILI